MLLGLINRCNTWSRFNMMSSNTNPLLGCLFLKDIKVINQQSVPSLFGDESCRLMAVEVGLSLWASSLVSVLQLITRSRDMSAEEQTAAGLIPSARLIAFITARPQIFILFTALSVPVVWSCWWVEEGDAWIWRQREKENHCLTLDSGRLLFLAKAAIITRATSNKIVQARLGN